MGKVVSIARAKKRRDKKYNPYKTNPLNNELTKAVNGSGLEDAIEKHEDGSVKLDSAGKPIFKDIIEWNTNGAQINAIWTAIKAIITEKLVPPHELDAAFDLMAIVAKMHRMGSKDYKVSLPVNYFVGTWHILNSCRKFNLFGDDKEMATAIDGLTMWFAQRIDMYHHVKSQEVKLETTPRPKLGSKIEYYSEDVAKLDEGQDPPDHNGKELPPA